MPTANHLMEGLYIVEISSRYTRDDVVDAGNSAAVQVLYGCYLWWHHSIPNVPH